MCEERLILCSESVQPSDEAHYPLSLSYCYTGTPIKMIFRGKSLRDVGRAAKKGAIGEPSLRYSRRVLVLWWNLGSSVLVLTSFFSHVVPAGAVTSGVLHTTMGTGSSVGARPASPADSDTENGVSAGARSSKGGGSGKASGDAVGEKGVGKRSSRSGGRDGISKKSVFSGSIRRPADKSEAKRFRPKK